MLEQKLILTRAPGRVKKGQKPAIVHSQPRREKTQVDVWRTRADVHLAASAFGQVQFSRRRSMPGPIVCSICDKTEEHCTCERYCTICKGQHKVRLCADGLYYCPDCREACDVALANNRGN